MRKDVQHKYSELQAIAEQIMQLRLQRGLSQMELAALMNTTQACISRLENGYGEPRLSTLQRIAEALGVRMEVRFVANKPQETDP